MLEGNLVRVLLSCHTSHTQALDLNPGQHSEKPSDRLHINYGGAVRISEHRLEICLVQNGTELAGP